MGRFSFFQSFSVNELIFLFILFFFSLSVFIILFFEFPGSICLIFRNDYLIGSCNIPPKV